MYSVNSDIPYHDISLLIHKMSCAYQVTLIAYGPTINNRSNNSCHEICMNYQLCHFKRMIYTLDDTEPIRPQIKIYAL